MSRIQTKAQLMCGSEIDRSLVRLAHEIVEKIPSSHELVNLGVQRREAVLGTRLTNQIMGIIDRGRPDLPVKANDVGHRVETTDHEIIEFKGDSIAGEERVLLMERLEAV